MLSRGNISCVIYHIQICLLTQASKLAISIDFLPLFVFFVQYRSFAYCISYHIRIASIDESYYVEVEFSPLIAYPPHVPSVRNYHHQLRSVRPDASATRSAKIVIHAALICSCGRSSRIITDAFYNMQCRIRLVYVYELSMASQCILCNKKHFEMYGYLKIDM